MSKRPNGLPDETNFEIVTTESNALKDGEVKVVWREEEISIH